MSKLCRQYLTVTFMIMVLCWGTCLVCSMCGISLADFPLLYVPYMLGGFSPTIASYIVQKKHCEVSGFKAWLRLIFDFRHNLYSYLLIPVVAGVFFLCLCRISGYESGAPLFAVVFMIPMMLFGGGLEETGWRGVMQPELEKKYGYFISTVLVSAVWWIWHLPLFYIRGVGQYGADFVGFGINVIGLSFALAAIKKITNSTWLCILFHCIINSLHGVYLVGEDRLGKCVAAGVMILLSCSLVTFQKKKQVFR